MMNVDARLAARNDKFSKSIGEVKIDESNLNLQTRQNFSLQIRKQKLNSLIDKKRFHRNSENEFQVSLDNLMVSPNFEKDFKFSENKILFCMNILEDTGQKLEHIKFCVRYIRDETGEMDNEIASKYSNELMEIFRSVVVLFFNTGDKQLKYETSWIMLNLLYYYDECSEELLSKDYFPNIVYKLCSPSEEYPIINHLIFIIGNIISAKNSKHPQLLCQLIEENWGLVEKLTDLIKRDNISSGLKVIVLWNFTFLVNLFRYSPTIHKLEEIIPIISKILFSCISSKLIETDVILESLKCLNSFIKEDPQAKLVQKLLSLNITKTLDSLFILNNITNDIKRFALRVFMYILSGTEEEVNSVSCLQLITFILKELEMYYNNINSLSDDDINYLHEFLWISSVICQKESICIQIFNSSFPEQIKHLLDNIYSIFRVFADVLPRKEKTQLFRLRALDSIMNHLKCLDNGLVMETLLCIEEFLQMGNELNTGMNNIVKMEMEVNDNFNLFCSLEGSKNEEISKAVKKLLKTYWNNDDMNLDFLLFNKN